MELLDLIRRTNQFRDEVLRRTQCSGSVSRTMPTDFTKSAKVSALSWGRSKYGFPAMNTVLPVVVSNISHPSCMLLGRSREVVVGFPPEATKIVTVFEVASRLHAGC